MTDRYQTDLSDALRTSGVAFLDLPMPDVRVPLAYEESEGLEFLDDRRPAFEFIKGFGTATAVWLFVAGVALALGVRPW